MSRGEENSYSSHQELPPLAPSKLSHKAIKQDGADENPYQSALVPVSKPRMGKVSKLRQIKASESQLDPVQDSMDRYKLGKLEALKFKMELQTKNLKLLQDHNDIMSGIYQEDNNKVDFMQKPYAVKRENRVFQNQQINRLERDLEKTSKQLQSELTIL